VCVRVCVWVTLSEVPTMGRLSVCLNDKQAGRQASRVRSHGSLGVLRA